MDSLSSAIHDLGWVLRRLPSDYGIDAEIEIRDSRRQMSGAFVRAQVKGLSGLNGLANGLTVKVGSIRYWLMSPVPVLIVAVVNPGNNILMPYSTLTDTRSITLSFN
jgi:hypothetical protein